jgi:hypothetical protein
VSESTPPLAGGLQVGELYCFPTGPAEYAYVPGPPRIELQADGRATVGLLIAPPLAVLSTQTVWASTPEALEAAAREIGSREGIAEPSLRMADLAEAAATLKVQPAGAPMHRFTPRTTSGTEAHRAVISENLTADERDAVVSALRGTPDVVTIHYQAMLLLHESLTAQISGDLAEDLKHVGPQADLATCAARVDAALAAGRLTLTTTASANVSRETRERIESALRGHVGEYLFEQLGAIGADAQYMSSLSVRKVEAGVDDVRYPIERSLDVGAWFAAYHGPDVMTSATP